MRAHTLLTGTLLICAPLIPLVAAPVGSFSASFPSYTFSAFCADPVGASIAFPGAGCAAVDIDYDAVGSSSVFSNAQLIMETILVPALLPPFAFTGTFSLINVDNPADTIVGTLTGQGNPVGPPGPPVGFPPFSINAILVATGGTGAYSGALGSSILSGTANFTTLSTDTTTAAGNGSITLAAVPEPSTGPLSTAVISLVTLCYRFRRKRLHI